MCFTNLLLRFLMTLLNTNPNMVDAIENSSEFHFLNGKIHLFYCISLLTLFFCFSFFFPDKYNFSKKWPAGNCILLISYSSLQGSVSVSMSIYQTFFCFACTHLTSGEKEADAVKRNSDSVYEIHRRTHFNAFSRIGLPKSIHDHEWVYLPIKQTFLLYLQNFFLFYQPWIFPPPSSLI